MLHLSQDDIEYLKPSSEANFIQHPAYYIKSGSDYNSTRAIFYEVDLEPYELKEIENLKQEMTHSGVSLNSSWGDRELLKYLYAAKFNVQKAVANLKESLRFRTEVQLLPVTDKTLEVLHSGVIYPYGKDKQSRPILIIDLDKLDTKTADRNELSVVINFYLDSLKQHSFIQGKVENIIIIIDAAGKEFNALPFEKFDSFLKRIIMSHPASVEKVYILNASSSFKTQGNVVRGFLENDSFDKVQFISSSDLFKLQESIPSAQLETKYGGSATNVTNFWPVSSILSRKSYVYEAPVQTYERYTSSGVYGNTSYFDFDTTEHKKIYERTTMTLPVTEYTYTERVVKSSAPPVEIEEPAPLDDKYDFNDYALLDLVARESRLIGGSKPSPLKLTDDVTYKLDHHDTYKNTNNYTETYEVKKIIETSYYPTSDSTPYPVETEKKSAVVYQDTGRNSHVESWSMKKYLANVDKEEEPEEKATIEFCGLCVSNRRASKA